MRDKILIWVLVVPNEWMLWCCIVKVTIVFEKVSAGWVRVAGLERKKEMKRLGMDLET